MSLKIVAEPTVEPISLDEARTHLGLTPYDDSDGSHPHDAMVQGFITAVRTWAEEWTGLSLAVKTYELALDEFPEVDEIELPMAPVIAIESVTHVVASETSDGETDYTTETMLENEYVLDGHQKPAWLLPAAGTSWPTTASVINAVRVRYLAGYLTEANTDYPEALILPGAIKSAMFLLLGDFYENRGNTIIGTISSELPMGVKALLRPYRVNLGMA